MRTNTQTATTTTAAPVAVATPPAPTGIVDLSTLDLGAGFGFAPGQTAVGVPTPKAPRVPGVAANCRSRSYYAGVLIAQTGHANGITAGMVGQLNTMYGTANAVESASRLRYAWAAIRGYLAANGLPVPGPCGSNGNSVGS